MTEHMFQDSLDFSHDQADQPWWETVYRRAFPDMVSMVDLRQEGWHQRAGRDRAVVLSSGRSVYIDEKVRKRCYGDVLLEVWSQYPKNAQEPHKAVPGAKPGWAREPKDCDWLAYAFLPSHTCHLFPFLGIRAALETHKAEWVDKAYRKVDGFRWCRAENRTYDTYSIAIPLPVLREAINNALTISWEAEAA